jgi:G2/mitotic-specific cyclin-B, other
LQDVTNAGRPSGGAGGSAAAAAAASDASKGGKNAVVNAKRATGVKTRSMGRSTSTTSTATASSSSLSLANPARVGHHHGGAFLLEQRDAESSARESRKTKPDPSSYQMTGNFDNIDERDVDDPLCAAAYVEDMYATYREKEDFTSVRPLYMESQPYINEKMRAILIDWLIEVHLKFKLVPDTLYLTVNLIDRYLERLEVSRPKLQLVGVTCLLIASKYEEIYPPELRDLVYICDRAYTRQDVRHMI